MTTMLNGQAPTFSSNGHRPHPLMVQQAEAYRILRSQLEVTLEGIERPVVLVTSALAGEGKTTTTVNLAAALAVEGRRVGLVDLDLRHPDVHNWFQIPNDRGVSDVLQGHRSLAECVQQVEVTTAGLQKPAGLQVLTAGPQLANPAEMLSGRAARLLQVMLRQSEHPRPDSSQELDIVLVDSPPVLPVADALVVGRIVSGALLVLLAGKTPASSVHRAKDALTRNQTRLFGVVMNGAHAGTGYGYGYGYAYGYR